MPGDVFEKDPFGFDLADDAGDLGPEVPLVVLSPPLSGVGEWLAGIACEHGVEGSAEWPRVEGPQVIPYRGGGEVSGPLGGDEDAAGVFLPLDKASGMEPRLGEHEAHIKSSAACAEGESVSGT